MSQRRRKPRPPHAVVRPEYRRLAAGIASAFWEARQELTRERRLELDLKGVCSGAPARA